MRKAPTIPAAESELAQMRKEKASQDAIAKKLQSQLAVLSSQISVIQSQQDEIDRKGKHQRVRREIFSRGISAIP